MSKEELFYKLMDVVGYSLSTETFFQEGHKLVTFYYVTFKQKYVECKKQHISKEQYDELLKEMENDKLSKIKTQM